MNTWRVMIGAVAMSAAVMAFMGSTCDGTVLPNASARFVFEDLNAAILSISGTTANNVYAVGGDPAEDDLGPYVLHYDGTNWRRLQTGVTGALWWISVEPIGGDFWMAGENGNILRHDAAADDFEDFATPGTETIFGIWGAGGDDIWAVGGDLEAASGGVIWHYDGAAWTTRDLTAVNAGGVPTLYKVWGRDADDVFAVGSEGTILHFNGTNWSAVDNESARTLFTISGDGSRAFAVGGFGDAAVVEQDGDSFADNSPDGALQLNGVFVRGEQAVAVGNEVTVAYRGDTAWEIQNTGLDSIRDFHATWIDPDGGIWAVGGNLGASLNHGVIAYIGTATIGANVVQE